MKKLFVLVRKDMPMAYQAGQAGHAVAEFMKTYPGEWNNEILVYLWVDNEHELEKWFNNLHRKIWFPVRFREPDLNNESTALAVLCSENIVGKLNLMGVE